DAGTPATGNVFASGSTGDVADRIGADTTATPVTAVSFGATPGTLGSPLSGAYGALTLNADGSYSYALDNTNPTVNALKAGDSLSEVFSYTITDADGDTSTATLTITVQGRNDPPVAVDDSATTPEDTPISGSLLSNDSDIDTPHADLRVQSFTIAGDPAVHAPGATAAIPGVGTLTISATGDWLFTPATDYSGPVPVVTYTLTDGTLTDTATLTLDVTPVTDPPTLDLPPASVDEDGSVPLVILPAIGDTLPADLGIEHLTTITISGIPEGSRLSNAAGDPLLPAGGVLTLTPAQLAGLSFAPPRDYSGPIVLNVTAVAQDGSAPPASITGPLSVTVRPVTDTPVIDVVSASQTPDGVLHLDLASHVTDTVLTDAGTEHVDRVTISGLPEGTTVTLADGTQIPVIGGVATLAPDQLTGIRVQPPGGFADDLVLQITSWAVDGSAPEASATTQVILGHGGGKVPPINPPLPPVIPPGPDPRPSGLPAEPPEPIDTPFPFLFNYGRLSGFERDYEGHDQELYLYGQARDQLMVELRTDSFTQPKDLFRHTNPAEHLSFEAVQPDGRPLPAWLKFDAGSLRFSGTPPAGFGGVDVVIIAYDSQGRSATALFRIRPAREVEPAPAVPVAPQLPPPPEPAPASAPPSDGAPPQAARSLPAADWLAALGLHDDAAAHPAPALAPDAGHDGFSARLQQALPPTLAEQSRALADVLLAAD
ncbi:MAG TPA: Ig-like domain-containing protein, partial [Plasticicumulans sp.]|nr:Ig-like domain-containing protein [Plasticicumulans sp.]